MPTESDAQGLYSEVMWGDCLQVLRAMEDSSIDSVVTDPPYGIAFMGREWDSFKATNEAKSQVVKGLGTGMRMTTAQENRNFQEWCEEWAAECLRVLKPGGWLLAFGGSRMYHRLAAGIEDAGFELRDTVAWTYSTGFPKSLDVSKAIDKAAGVEREVTGERVTNVGMQGGNFSARSSQGVVQVRDKPATAEAAQWQGWGTALKPALEPITLARKPFKGTVAANVLQHGTGALNIDGCRVGDNANNPHTATGPAQPGGFAMQSSGLGSTVQGRWPANLIHDGSDEVEAVLGEAMRFFYCPKPSKAERGEGNAHPTVKPVGLMRYLCRLVTPPGGIVLDPFCGSGTTGVAAALEGFDFAGIEREAEYLEIARRRLEAVGVGVAISAFEGDIVTLTDAALEVAA
jgi:DNA modification methylase